MGKNENITAQQARIHSRALRMNTFANLDDPIFNTANPLLADTSDDAPNQLHTDYQGKDLKIDIPQFEQGGNGRPGNITLHWQGDPIGTPYAFTTPITNFPVTMVLPASATRTEGSFLLHYVVNIRGNISQSAPMTINIDKTAPNNNVGGAPVSLPAEVEASGITRAYLDANGGKVLVTVDGGYVDAKIGDVVEVWYGPSIPLASKVGEVIRANLADPITFDLLESMLGEEGEKSLFYKLVDRKGNAGPNSEYKRFNVELTAPPAGLAPPTVPLASDGLIDYADVVDGVRVNIAPYSNWFSRDLVIVTFDGIDHAPQQMPQSGASILLPYSLVFGGNLGEKASSVTYRITRGGNSFDGPGSADFKVDLRTPGPDPVDPPAVVHPGLNLPSVKGAVSPEGQLKAADRDQDVEVTILIYDAPAKGEYVQLYWNGEVVPGARYEVQGDEAPTFQIPFDLPWDIIDAAGNGDIPAHYIVGHALNDNVLSSAARVVNVEGVPIVLPQPSFQNLDLSFPPEEILNCPSLRVEAGALVAEIAVPSDDRLAGNEMTFLYQGWSDESGTVPIDGTDDSFTYTPSAEEAASGFTVTLPYETALKETRQAYGSIHYTVAIGGVTVDSPKHLVIIELLRPGGFYCEIPASRSRP